MTWFRLSYLVYLLPAPFLVQHVHAGTVAYLMGLGVVTVVFLAGLIRDALPDAPERPADAPEVPPGSDTPPEEAEALSEAPADADGSPDLSDLLGDGDDVVLDLVEAIAERVIGAIRESLDTGGPVRIVIGRSAYVIDARSRDWHESDPTLRN